MREEYNYNSYVRRKRQKKGSVFVWLQLLLSIAAVAVLYMTDLMPLQHLIVGGAVLLVLFLFTLGLCNSYRSRSGGRVIAVILCLLLGVLLAYLFKTQSVLDRITGADTRVDEMTVLVLRDDPAKTISDTEGYVFGTASVDSQNAAQVMEAVQKETGSEAATLSFTTYAEEAAALLNGEIGAVVFNEAYREMIKQIYPGFNEDTRVLYAKTIRTKNNIAGNDKKVSKEPFTVYITGIDTYGEISLTSRSDVNIIATVNPSTHQVLLVSTPRDGYVELPTYGAYDKLTHAGIYGVQESILTLENLYDIHIDYYVRVNFSGFEKIVDALGGITVESDYAFEAWDGEWFDEGVNELNGSRALSFARERKAFGDGDFQRGRNQMKVIKALIDKAESPAILGNYSKVLDSVSDSFETSMSRSQISELVKMQLAEDTDWDVETYETVGYPDWRNTYSYGSSSLDVIVLDESCIEEAKAMMAAVRDGGSE